MDSNFGGDFGDQNFIDEIQDDLGNHFLEALHTIETFMNNLEPGIFFGSFQNITGFDAIIPKHGAILR